VPNAEPTNAEAFNAGSEGSPAETSPSRAITLRAIVVGLVITYLTAFWVREAEIKSVGVFVSESVPTIPAVASLLLLLAVNHLLRRRTRHAFSRGELLFIFFFVTVATTPYNCGVVRIFLAFMTAPFYFMAPENKLAEAQKFIPQWAAVHDLHAVRGFYEGLPGKPVPWDVWIVPVLVWVGFFMALWLAMACLIMLMHRPWIEKEKLGFPLFQLPLRLTDVRKEGGGVSAFLRNPVMWIGFGIAFFSDGTHMLHAVFPYLPAFGKEVSFPTFTEPPWNALGPITLFRRPILIGFGYLVSTEITFSVWATFWLERLMAVLLSALGNREPGNPYMREQGFGAFIAVALVLLYINRQHLAAIIKSSVSRQPSEGGRDRWALWGFALSVLTLVTFCRLLGMLWWVGLVYIGIFLAFALTVARIRAEVGIPLAWLFPYGMQKTMVISTLGTAPLSPGGSAATLTALATLAFMQFSNTVSFAGYQVESLRMGRFVGEKPRRILVALTGAFLIGLLLSFYFHIATFYQVGANAQSGVYGLGFYGSSGAISEYSRAIENAASPVAPNKPQVVAGLTGFSTVFLLQVLRTRFIGFPFHPLGFAAANAYGHLLWWSFFFVWIVKVTVLRYGGLPLYRKTVPLFLGFALGHFFTSGVVWGTLGALGKDIFKKYIVCFG